MAYKIIETESFKKSLSETFDYISEKFNKYFATFYWKNNCKPNSYI